MAGFSHNYDKHLKEMKTHKTLFRRILFAQIFLALCLLAGFIWLIHSSIDLYKTQTAKYEAYIGVTLIQGSDTLNVIDYSIIWKNLTLSNGTKISPTLIDKEVIKMLNEIE